MAWRNNLSEWLVHFDSRIRDKVKLNIAEYGLPGSLIEGSTRTVRAYCATCGTPMRVLVPSGKEESKLTITTPGSYLAALAEYGFYDFTCERCNAACHPGWNHCSDPFISKIEIDSRCKRLSYGKKLQEDEGDDEDGDENGRGTSRRGSNAGVHGSKRNKPD